MDTKEKNASWLKGPMVSKKWDPFLSFLLAFTGAMVSSTVYPQLDMPIGNFSSGSRRSRFLPYSC